MRIKQSVCYPILKPDDMSFDTLFKASARIGYKAVEMWYRGPEFDEVVRTAKKYKLVIASMVGHESLPDGLNKRCNHDRIEAELKTSIDVAAKVGIRGVICFSGNRQPFMTEMEAIEACVDGLKRIAPYAEKKGVNVNLELLNSKVDHAGYQCDHTQWGLSVVERVNSPRVRLLFDIYHMSIMEGDLIRTITSSIPWIAHFHTAGNPGRNDMDDTQELNYAGICRAIASTGYSMYVGHELKPKGDVIEALETTFKICDQG